ncbi:2-dehydropantoate 2-reductase N-terminal domain-containing protein [Amycolatopsis rhabdoformis]|uniref:2-dehydropantoate 2-reductase N-terminal domain-containing protein n=1 Tax=Amycolatopsis rhabdoformis TaxID=1448059 RepID=A0ABZ1IJG2_9PSEU|nr:2-dehydropantoate 2-reductase N-terminal domain-containing protein [Amycolatopsis rhabdoformis]WSE34333.1 2-dehydropantoate 2-reductase N-terminal domain-containing protein [Amycolatopsis rhabdoformis]
MNAYTVLGAGAIGGSLAHHLGSTGHPVVVVDVDADHVEAIRTRGLTLLQPDGTSDVVRVAAAHTPGEAAALGLRHERVLLATKAQHVAAAAAWLAPFLAADGFAVLCQNSDTFDSAARSLGPARVVPAFVNFAADVVEPGVVRVGGPGEVVLGERTGAESTRVRSVVADLAAFGHVTASTRVNGFLWAKRGIAAILTTTALVDEHIADVIDSARPLMAVIATEVYRIARAEGVRPEPIDGIVPEHLMTDAEPGQRDEAFDRLVAFTRGMAGKPRSGVFRDLAVRHRPTEARPELVRLAGLAVRHGLTAPALVRLAALIGELEQGTRTFGRRNLADLAASTTCDLRPPTTGKHPAGKHPTDPLPVEGTPT